ncbi:ABC transporter permease [Nocardia sp. CDC159]|uniref:Transport permease protein n=1 Tax=Nocardia pulmonis TaxID=2951408 RepID=A0A9X2EIX4_9NOCA|nr:MULTISPECIES: ABC transporter permease [Nocardia]MCM6779083.1 ABC transporter permease [Nocardia pulmonis]MCM6791973.1 ABC transporter permease [Nocardia sp. CDC159]
MSASTAVLKVEARLFVREPGALFWVLAFPSLLLLGLGLIPKYREWDPSLGGHRIIDFYVPSVVLVALVTASLLSMPSALTTYRERGILRRMRTTPARPSNLLVAQLVLHAAAAVIGAVLAVAVGRIVWGVALPQQHLAYVVTLLLATLSGLAMGAVITAVARTVKAAQAVGLAVFFPAMFAAGIYVPIQVLPNAVRKVIELVPFGAAAQALHQAASGSWPWWPHLAVLALWIVVLMAIATRWFRWE